MMKPAALLPVFALLATACGGHTSTSSLRAAPALSATFSNTCANCHGAQGEGGFGPALAGVAYKDFTDAVRNGKNGVMPQFAPAVYADKDLQADYTALTGKPAQ